MKSLSLQWHLTNACDQRCIHCYIYNGNEPKGKELTLNECYNVIDEFNKFAKSLNCNPSYILTGGDPILFKYFWEVIDYLKKKNIKYSILGNPFHINYEIAKKLKESGCSNYQMSLDGLEATHDRFREPNSFKKTIETIKILNETGIRTIIMSTVSKQNYKEVPDLVDLVVRENVSNFAFARYCPTEEDKNPLDDMIKPHEYKEFLEIMWNKYQSNLDKNTSFTLKDHLWKLFLYEKGIFKTQNEDIIFDGCHCAISHLTLLSEGTVYACRRFKSPIGNIKENTFAEIYWGDKMKQYKHYDNFIECSKCELLNYCRGCPAVSYGLTNNFYSKDPQCWRFSGNYL